MIIDPEISAMSNVYEAMKGLDSLQMKRLFSWLTSKFGLDEEATLAMNATLPVVRETAKVEANVEPIAEPITETKVELKAEPLAETKIEKKTRRKAGQKGDVDALKEAEPVHEKVVIAETSPLVAEEKANEVNDEEETEEETPQVVKSRKMDEDEKAVSTKGFGLKRYKTIENLFLSANIKTVSSRILLAAAFLQEKLNFTEIGSYDINSRLKKMGYGVPNITTALNGLFKKNPPWLEHVEKVDAEGKLSKRRFIVTEEGLKIAKSYLKGISE